MLPHFLKTAPVGIPVVWPVFHHPTRVVCRAGRHHACINSLRGKLSIAGPSRRSIDFRGSLNTRRDEPYHDTSLSDIVQKVAARNKLNATLAAGLSTIKVSHIDQTQETATTFITQLASLDTAPNKEQSGITLDLTRSLRKQVFCVPQNGCRHFVAISETGPCGRARFVRAEGYRQQKTRFPYYNNKINKLVDL
ncbi:hypothetical protein [Serratia plymuthica]|uniref:hypothetical protein n=2 Tax=Serratia plymuthica TaxID=82996 RepID=UPI001F3FB7E8|nr:hypothetical protein [Serratia plymuthica]